MGTREKSLDFEKKSNIFGLYTTRNRSTQGIKPLIQVAPSPSLVVKCNQIKLQATKTREAILREIQEALQPIGPFEQVDRVFHKSNYYLERRQKIEENVIRHKYQKSAKLEKIKSIFDKKSTPNHEFISNEDLMNEEAINFLNLNKRKFGESSNGKMRFKESKKKPNSSNTGKTPATTQNHKKDLILKISQTPENKILRKSEKKLVDLNLNSPVNKFIFAEMKKLWPTSSENIFQRKKKILQVKIEKLQHKQEENMLSPPDLSKNNQKIPEEKFKMDSMIHEHIRSLRKKITLSNKNL